MLNLSSPLLEICAKYPHAVSRETAISLYNDMPPSYCECVGIESFVQFMSGKSRNSLLWHDYEAGGTDAKRVAAMQCASIRTDLNLNIIDTPLDWYCKLHGDRLPHPEAIKITGINPWHCVTNGLPEPEFFRAISQQMSFPGTCNTGYNSLSYDDEVTRFGFWRNLIPPYNREWANQCSRWDLYPVTAAYAALNVNGINWPTKEDGSPTLKLEDLAKANHIQQDHAHNALDDVKALIGWARLLKSQHPTLWDRLFDMRKKNTNKGIFSIGRVGWHLHNKVGANTQFKAPVILLGPIPGDNQSWLYARLDKLDTLRACFRLSTEQIRERLFSKKEVLDTLEVERPGIGALKLNKQPQFFPLEDSLLGDGFHIEMDLISAGKNLLNAQAFVNTLGHAISYDDHPIDDDVTCQLYSAGFASNNDQQAIKVIANSSLASLNKEPLAFEGAHYNALLKRLQMQYENSDPWWQYCKTQISAPCLDGKHQSVNWANAMSTLEKTDMPETLKSGYIQFLNHIQKKTGLPPPG